MSRSERVLGTALPDLARTLDRLIVPGIAGSHRALPEGIWEQVLVGPARELLSRPGKQFRARLVELAFELAGGPPAGLPVTVAHVVELVHAGSLIVDDVQDGSHHRRGAPALHRLIGVPRAINTGTWLYFAAFDLIERAGMPATAALRAHRRLAQTMLRSHEGQALDLALDVTELRRRDVPQLAGALGALKTGTLVGFACELGAIAAGAPDAHVSALARFGGAIGSALQQLDDLGGLRNRGRRPKGIEDLAGRRVTWAWAYLARSLDDLGFAGLQRRLRDAPAAELDGLADELAALLGDGPAREPRERLALARGDLARAFPGHPALARADAAIARLERDYG